MRKLILILTLLLTQSCSALESDYDKLMNPIKKIKLAEQKAGKPSPTFDGVVEPNFPDEKENNKKLEGVDSNHDGVRDDIEIWINRTAEDAYVRWAMKDYYKKFFSLFKAIYENQTEPVIHSEMSEVSDAGSCLSWMQTPYSKEYIKKYHKDSNEMNSSKILDLFPNTSVRATTYSKWNSYQINGALGGDNDYCRKSKVGIRYIDLVKKYQEHRKW
ncbi:MAG: hypothetical protein H7177_00265 [Rhizobacter sp.]|nr:hypothetical protein [Bacteriovorax sp.]